MCTFPCSNKYLENRQVISPDYRRFVCQCHEGMFVNMDFVGVITVCIQLSFAITNGNFRSRFIQINSVTQKMWGNGQHLILTNPWACRVIYPAYKYIQHITPGRTYTDSKTLFNFIHFQNRHGFD